MSPPAHDLPVWPDDRPELLAFLPLVHSAWADGVLTPIEIEAICALVEAHPWITDADRHTLAAWLDARAPPSPSALAGLRARIRQAFLPDEASATHSLSDLGLALARSAAGGSFEAGSDQEHALREVEARLGVVGTDAARRALGGAGAPLAEGVSRTAFGPGALHEFLDADHSALRSEVMGLLETDSFRPPPMPSLDAYRDWVLQAVARLAAAGYGRVAFPAEFGGSGDAVAGVVVFETLAYGDLSVLVKFGVQFGLFGGSVLSLGTRRHHEAYLDPIGTLGLPGCYAMTETGHGSNVRGLETTATFDAEVDADSIVVHTPHDGASKDWIGNAALHGRMATVFARLLVGGDDHGVHAVLVPLRRRDGTVLPGIRIQDRGRKEGLNGVDNGRIWFDQVRVPRLNLLDRFGSIDAQGVYRSPISSSGRRFFTMLGTLVTGRVSIAAASVSAAKSGLTIAVRYADRRRQFGPEGEPEVPVLEYQVVQRSLLPRLAATYGLHFAIRDLQRRLGITAPGEDTGPDFDVRAAGLKAYASRHCVETLQACREVCGGQGYLWANRLAGLKADTDVFTTFEGANAVLLQLAAKGLLTQFRHQMGDLHFWGTVRYLAERAGTGLAELNPVLTRRADAEHLRDPDFHSFAFSYKEERLLRSVALRLKRRLDDGLDSFRAINECQAHLVALAESHVERIALEAFQDAVARAPSPGLSESLATLCALFALERIEAHRAWYLEAGLLEPPKSRAVRTEVSTLCQEVRECAVLFVDAFGIPDAVLGAPAAMGGGFPRSDGR